MAEGVFTAISNAVHGSPLSDPKNWHKPSSAPGDKSGFYNGASYSAARMARKQPEVTAAAPPKFSDGIDAE